MQAVKQLSGMVADMAHLITGAAFNPFFRSSREKCSSLWSAFERLHASVVSDIGDLIDASFRSPVHEHPPMICLTVCLPAQSESAWDTPCCAKKLLSYP